MNRLLLLLTLSVTLFLTSCANDLTPVQEDRGPAPYSPDPTANLPTFREPGPLGNPGGY